MNRFVPLLVLTVLAACSSLEPIEPKEPDLGILGDAATGVVDRETAVYTSTWKGIPAGRATFRSKHEEGRFETEADIVTTGVAAFFYGLDLRFEATSDTSDLLSRRWKFIHGKGEEGKTVDVRFLPGAGRLLAVTRDAGKVWQVGLDGIEGPGVREPIGAVYALRRTRLPTGRSFEMDMFTEEKLYRANILVTNRERIRVPAGEYDTVLVRADIVRLEDGRPVGQMYPSGVWLTDDELRVPVKVDMDTTIGRIVLELEAYEGSATGASAGNISPGP